MIEVKLTFQNEDELLNFFLGTHAVAEVEAVDLAPAAAPLEVVEVVEVVEPAPVESKKRGRKANAVQPEVTHNTGSSGPVLDGDPSGTETAVTEKAAETDVPPVAPQRDVTEDDVREALKNYNAANGMEAARDLLARFNATRISEVKPEDRASFLLEAAL